MPKNEAWSVALLCSSLYFNEIFLNFFLVSVFEVQLPLILDYMKPQTQGPCALVHVGLLVRYFHTVVNKVSPKDIKLQLQIVYQLLLRFYVPSATHSHLRTSVFGAWVQAQLKCIICSMQSRNLYNSAIELLEIAIPKMNPYPGITQTICSSPEMCRV